MIRKVLLSFIILCAIVSAQTVEWVDIVSLDIQTNPSFLHSPITMDNSGNAICARLVNFHDLYSLTYFGDIEIAKFNPDGIAEWKYTIYGKADITHIAVDDNNNIICTGNYKDTLIFNTTQLIHIGSGKGNFILKLNSSGNFIWVKDGPEFTTGYGEFTALDCDDSGNILLGMSDYPLRSKILLLDSDGNIISTIDQPGVATVNDIDLDVSGNIWITGFTSTNSQSFNGLDTVAPFSYSEYVVKYNSSGVVQWLTFVRDITFQKYNIETDNSGNAYLSGNLFDSTNFGNLHANRPQWVYDYFVTKINPQGDFLWLNQIPPGNASGDATIGNANFLSCNDAGEIYITGFFRGEIYFADGVILSPFDYYDAFVINYDPDGIVQWVKAIGSELYDQGNSVFADNNGNCYITGMVSENSTFDTISVSGGSKNLYLAKIKSDDVVSVKDGSENNNLVADNFILMQNYPNPFNPVTKIRFTIPSNVKRETSNVSLIVYDVLGNEVATLVNEELSPGEYEFKFGSHYRESGNLPSGIYFYQLKEGSFIQTKKMILLK